MRRYTSRDCALCRSEFFEIPTERTFFQNSLLRSALFQKTHFLPQKWLFFDIGISKRLYWVHSWPQKLGFMFKIVVSNYRQKGEISRSVGNADFSRSVRFSSKKYLLTLSLFNLLVFNQLKSTKVDKKDKKS